MGNSTIKLLWTSWVRGLKSSANPQLSDTYNFRCVWISNSEMISVYVNVDESCSHP